MAESITIKALQDASLDAKSLEEVVNGNDAKQVTTRLGENYPSVKKAIKTLFENGGLPATPFKTKALMTASALANDKYAMVTDGGADNGLYVKTAGAWVKSAYDPVLQAKVYTDDSKTTAINSAALDAKYKVDELQRVSQKGMVNSFPTFSAMNTSLLPNDSYGVVLEDTTTGNNGFYQKRLGAWIYLTSSPLAVVKDYHKKTGDAVITPYAPERINYDNINKKIEFDGYVYVENRDVKFRITTPLHLTIPTQGVFRIEANETLKTLRLVTVLSPQTDNWLNCGYVMRTATGFSTNVFVDYLIDGKPQLYDAKKVIRPSFGWSHNNELSVNVADSYTPTDPITMSSTSLTSTMIYKWYDDLVLAYPEYITRTLLGNDATGTLPIYQYRFKPILPNAPSNVAPQIPKIMLMTLHNESINHIYVYTLLREICNSWQSSDALTSMRHGLEFVVIPLGNPWGQDNASRKNANNVQLNKNFPVGWLAEEDTSPSWGGSAPKSEAETIAMHDAMVAEMPDVFFDCHSYGPWNNEGRSIWVSVGNERTRSAATSACTKIHAQYKKKYEWLVDVNKLTYMSHANINDGGISQKSAWALGAIGGNLETAWTLKGEPSGLTGHNSVVNIATDFLGTLILQCVGVLIVEGK